MKLKLFILLIFILFYIFAGFFGQISAQTRSGITVSPFIIEETVSPGQELIKIIIVTNNSDKKQIFRAHLQDFRVKGEVGEVLLLPAGSEKTSLLYWVELPQGGVEFAPRESKEISLTFMVPEKAGAGGYYGAIFFSSESPESGRAEEMEEEGVFVSLVHQVGVLVFLDYPKGAIEEARIKEFKTDKKFYDSPFKINFITRIENLGNIHIKPIGSIKIENMRGRETVILPFNRDGLNVLPESIRRFENFWHGNLAFGKYTAFLTLNFGTPADRGGAGMQTIFAETHFWIIPWKIIFIVLLILAFSIILFHFLYKRYKKNSRKINPTNGNG